MAVKFAVNPQELAKQAQNLQDLNERFKDEVQKMTEKEEALSKMWKGPARDEFHNSYAVDAEKLQKFYNGINQFIKALDDAAKEYATIEQNAASIAQKRS